MASYLDSKHNISNFFKNEIMKKSSVTIKYLKKRIKRVQVIALRRGLDKIILKRFKHICDLSENTNVQNLNIKLIILSISILILFVSLCNLVNSILSAKCLVPLNYLMWEAARPLAECDYCANVTKPIILRNVSREDFKKYTYTSKPIIVKSAISNWRAMKEFDYYMIRKLFEQTTGSYETFEDGCQFLNFKSDLFSLKEVFNMPDARVRNEPGQKPWYIGWSNCHSVIKAELRNYFSVPEFLPEDAEFPETENIFLGYEIGAVMHLDYIPRLMWQGQIRGSKNWSVAPVPECEHVCQKFQFYIEPGDVALLDTRVWYHATRIPKGQFSMTVQSEYG